MDESLLELENELKRMRPRSPSAHLLAGIEAGLASPEKKQLGSRATRVTGFLFPPWLTWRTTAAIAALFILAVALTLIRQPTPQNAPESVPSTAVVISEGPASAAVATPITTAPLAQIASLAESPAVVPAAVDNSYRPIAAASVLYDLREDGAVTLPNRTPGRRLRYRYVDTYTWKNPATHASLKWSIPRDEVRVLPASLH